MRQARRLTRARSPRQLPTDHDHDGGLGPIREYQIDLIVELSPAAAAATVTQMSR